MTEANWPSSAASAEQTGPIGVKLKAEQKRWRSAGTAELNDAYVATSLLKMLIWWEIPQKLGEVSRIFDPMDRLRSLSKRFAGQTAGLNVITSLTYRQYL